MENYILFRVFMYSYEYQVIKTLFESEKIKFIILNDTIISTYPFASIALGGIELLVLKEDKDRAKELCEKLEF